MTVIIPALIAIAVSFLLAPKIKRPGPVDGDAPVTTTQRGEYLPRVIGIRRVGPWIAWVGNRSWVGGGWLEGAFHCLCVGPANRLTGIFVNGENILTAANGSGPINKTTTPSGSTVTLPAYGSFRIYWGENDQPINSNLGALIGISSRWPHICYLQWTFFHLGSGAPTWPSIEYQVEVRPANYSSELGLLGNSPWLSGTTEGSFQDEGPNPGHVLYELMFEEFPLGLGLPLDRFEITDLALIADVHDSGVDYQYTSIVSKGESFKENLGEILRELGWGIRFSETDGRLRFNWISYIFSIPTIPEELIVGPLPEFEVNAADKQKTGILYTFANRLLNFEPTTKPVDDDSRADGSPNQKKVDISTVTDPYRASIVGNRIGQFELATDFIVRFQTQFEGRRIIPTQVIFLEDISCSLRVVSIKRQVDSPVVHVAAIRDSINTQQLGATVSNPGLLAPSAPPPDEVFDFVTSWTDPDAIIVLRLRTGNLVDKAHIWISADDLAFTDIAIDRTTMAGGLLTAGMDAVQTDAELEMTNPDDLSQVLDLQGDPASFAAGRQMVIIGSEIMFLEYVTDLGSGNLELSNITRGEHGTTPAVHSIGDPVFILKSEDIVELRSVLIASGTTLYLRSVPTGVDLDDVVSAVRVV